jgi:hypothetical protein
LILALLESWIHRSLEDLTRIGAGKLCDQLRQCFNRGKLGVLHGELKQQLHVRYRFSDLHESEFCQCTTIFIDEGGEDRGITSMNVITAVGTPCWFTIESGKEILG